MTAITVRRYTTRPPRLHRWVYSDLTDWQTANIRRSYRAMRSAGMSRSQAASTVCALLHVGNTASPADVDESVTP